MIRKVLFHPVTQFNLLIVLFLGAIQGLHTYAHYTMEVDADITPQSSFRQQMSAPSPVKEEAVVDDDDALSYFARLAEE